MSDEFSYLSSLLPAEFLSGDIDDKTLFPSNHLVPYDFTSASSTESESDDDDVTGLTRHFSRSLSLQEHLKPSSHSHLQKRVFSGSCPTTPFGQTEEDALERIKAAAGYVAKIKMKMMLMNNVNDDVVSTRGLLGAPFLVGSGPTLSHHQHHQQHLRRTVSGNPNYADRPLGFRQDAWPQLPVEKQRLQQNARGFLVKNVVNASCRRGNVAVKKQCTGTGVFIPRSYSDTLPEIKKKPGEMVQSFNKTIGPINPQQTDIHVGFSPYYQFRKRYELAELAMPRQNSVMLAQHEQHRSVPEK